MFASFRRLGQRDLKRLAKELHALLTAGASTDLAGCRDMVAQLHGHASWADAQATERSLTWKRARPEVLGEAWPTKWPHRDITLSANEMTLPRVLFGATGSGRSEALLSMFKTAVDNGQGGFYLDAKRSVQLPEKVLSFAKEAGRLSDVRILSLWAPQDSEESASWWSTPEIFAPEKGFSHTFNPFERATLADLREWWMPLWEAALEPLPTEEQRDALSFLDTLLDVLIEGRDLGLWPLDVQVLDQALENWWPLAQDARLSILARRRLERWRGRFVQWHTDQAALTYARGVLQALLPHPALRATVLPSPEGPQWVSANVDWEDMIRNRRLVVVLAPPLERMPPPQRSVLELITQSLASAFLRVLHQPGAMPEHGGMWIFDDVGLYLNDACLAIASRARRLNITVVSGALTFPEIKRHADPRQALRFVEQCGVKVFMRMHELDGVDEQWPSVGAHALDIRRQEPGEAHALIGDRVERLSLSYHAPRFFKNLLADLVETKVPPRWVLPLLGRPT